MSPIIHPISGQIRELGLADFLGLFDESVHSAILAKASTVEMPG